MTKNDNICLLIRFNERVLVQEMADSYNSTINSPLTWPLFRGPFTYKVASINYTLLHKLHVFFCAGIQKHFVGVD
jgi:hypothetical protein